MYFAFNVFVFFHAYTKYGPKTKGIARQDCHVLLSENLNNTDNIAISIQLITENSKYGLRISGSS